MKLLSKNSLITEIIIVLIIKSGFIFLIWWGFFSSPIDDDLDDRVVGDQLLGLQPHSQPVVEQVRKKYRS